MSQTQLPCLMMPGKTHCWDLARTIPADSLDFSRKDLHYLADCLRAVYICHLDNREYEVIIRPLEAK